MVKRELTRRQVVKGAGLGAVGFAADHHARTARAAILTQTTPGASRAPSCHGDWTPHYPSGFPKYDPPIRLSAPFRADVEFKDGDTITDNPMINRLREQIGVEYTVAWQASGAVAQQRFEQAIAVGELPDIFVPPSNVDLADLIANEAVEDIKDAWEATASDLVKEKRAYPVARAWKQVIRETRLYGIPFTYGPAYNIDNLGHIRQDWLDQIGASVPETIDDLTAVMRAFKEQALGQFGVGVCQRLVTYTHSLDPVFGAFGVMPTIWVADAEGSLVYGSIQPGIKDALAVLNGWYAEGLLDPDFFTKTEQDAEAATRAGAQGIYFAPWWTGSTVMIPMESENAAVKFATMPAPKGPDGRQGRLATSDVQAAVVFRAGIPREKVEAAITQLNWSTDMHVNWQQYQQYGEWRNSTAFTEGYEYVLDGCRLAPGPVENQYVYLDTVGFNFPALVYPSYQADIFRDIVAWRDKPDAERTLPEQFLLAQPVVNREADLYLLAADSAGIAIQNEFVGIATEEMIDLLPDLQQLEAQALTEIVIGERPLDAFDDFVEEWRASGGDTVTEEVNAWKRSPE